MIDKLQTTLVFIGFLLGFVLLGYRKGKKDSDSKHIKDMLKESQKEKETLQKINEQKNELENLSGDQLVSHRNELHNKNKSN